MVRRRWLEDDGLSVGFSPYPILWEIGPDWAEANLTSPGFRLMGGRSPPGRDLIYTEKGKLRRGKSRDDIIPYILFIVSLRRRDL